MTPPMFVCPLTDAERQALGAGRRSADAFRLRRSQILLASARGEPVAVIRMLRHHRYPGAVRSDG